MKAKKKAAPKPPKRASKPKAKKRAKAKPVAPVREVVTRKRHPKRDLAGTMFVALDLSPTEIARQLDIEIKTISKWRGEDNWDDARLVGRVTPMAIRKQILESIAAKLDQVKTEGRMLTDGEADSIGKLSKAAESFMREVGPQTILEVLYQFVWAYLDERDHELAVRMGPISLDYVKQKLNEAKGM